jgi:hypothetical protein
MNKRSQLKVSLGQNRMQLRCDDMVSVMIVPPTTYSIATIICEYDDGGLITILRECYPLHAT